ncbi:hypothetical protein EZV73_20235 [Acidaminobacter sp. JC074]|uniref:hypothetical protein n=1 Tax=Acidaminobacter sp. JC074 TaxID=2530199 RepID=UPI001F1017E9|nr:hypothetical protein [Acidaminobacter sp. JC074]MCH4889920.1 hypothetical protein [Acidaminobacter sp. JC074]
MNRELTAKIITTIKRRVSNWRFLLMMQLKKDFLLDAISSKSFYHVLLKHVENKDFTCQALKNAYETIYADIFDEPMKEDFLSVTYQYVLSKSFPDAVTIELDFDSKPFELYLTMLRVFSEFQKQSEDDTFMSVYPFELLTKEEVLSLEDQSEYKTFSDAFNNQYIYEMMKLNYEVTGHSTIEHILGVHYLALKLGRQLKACGVDIDLGRVSGAAAGHDIGKFGCRPEESKKIAYYHYYYTYHWFSELDIKYIKNVAVYHSTWDLELESLSVESLILIYSDFCVKRSKSKPGNFKMKFLTVDESFKVILDKLDNLDDKKIKRYEKVYLKLKNFHMYLGSLGIDTEVQNYIGHSLPEKKSHVKTAYDILDHGQKITDHIKVLAIEKSIQLMHQLRHVESLNELIQVAKDEKDVLMLRRYLFIFEEYSTYLTPEQKLITIHFLNNYMIHGEEDVRKASSQLIGQLIADYDENYTKELPERAQVTYTVETKFNLIKSIINHFIYDDIRLTPIKRQRQITSHKELLVSLFRHADDSFGDMLSSLLMSYYERDLDAAAVMFMLEIVEVLPERCLQGHYKDIIKFIEKHLHSTDDIRMMALMQLRNLLKTTSSNQIIASLTSRPRCQTVVESYFLEDLMETGDDLSIEAVKSSMYLSNLKSATPKTVKVAQIDMLYRYSLIQDEKEKFYTSMHFCNILKVSEFESVRNKAGECLLNLFEELTSEQKNDIVIELIRALEIEGYGFTRYMPHYLGQLVPTLEIKEYKEIVEDIKIKMNNAGVRIRVLLLDTLGTMIQKWLSLGSLEHMDDLLGCVFKGFYSGDKLTSQSAFNVLSKEIIGNLDLTLEERHKIYGMIYKKLHFFLMDNNQDQLDIFNYSVGLHYVYKFIADFEFFSGNMTYKTFDKVAFYNGTFDPFSLGQKSAAVDAFKMGFEVYIHISEFQWRRRTQPSLMRKKIVDMSIADQMHVHTFPQHMPINLRNSDYLRKLRGQFKDKDVYIIVGEEALIQDHLYDDPEHDIFDMPHIIYKRDSIKHTEEHEDLIKKRIGLMRNDVIIRSLEYRYDMIDVAQIRRNLDKNWDSSDVIDDLAMYFIKKNRLYKNEPQFKSVVALSDMAVKVIALKSYENLEETCLKFDIPYDRIKGLYQGQAGLEREILMVVEASTEEVLAFTVYAKAKREHLFEEIKSLDVLKEIASEKIEKIVIVDEIAMKPTQKHHALDQIILTETLMHLIPQGYEYAVVKCHDPHKMNKEVKGVIVKSGFVEHRCTYSDELLFAVDMRRPVVINLDGTTRMKADYRQNESIRYMIKLVRTNLQQALVNLYPGILVLSFDRSMLYNHLIREITRRNQVTVVDNGQVGSSICVPYGDIFKRWLLPNTITKAFHTERYYDEEILKYDVWSYPGYISIEDQARVLKAYDKPIILVDDLVDKGNRLKAINRYLKKESIEVDEVVVGIMSERGRKLFELEGMKISSAYYIPKIRVWFNESDVYPFIGGDSVKRQATYNFLPSVNLMLPYVYPRYIKDVSKAALFDLSKVCLENALVIFGEIEKVYSEINNRILSLEHLREVMITPRVPDIGEHLTYDENYKPTDYLRSQLLTLEKMKAAFRDT